MCLKKLHIFPKIAWKPIEVYKVLRFERLYMYTPVRGVPVKHGTVLKNVRHWLFGIFRPHLEGEIVHSFIKETTADNFAYNKRCFSAFVYGTVSATIPRFSLYWLGTQRDIGSTRLIIN